MMGLLCFWIVLELQRYWKRFRAFSSILVSALRLTYTGSYCVIQRCFSERTSGLRVYFKNVQLQLFICLVWSSGDVPLVYGSSGRGSFNLKLVLTFQAGPTSPPLPLKQPLGCLGTLFAAHTLPLPALSLFSLTLGFSWWCRHQTVAGASPAVPNLSHL